MNEIYSPREAAQILGFSPGTVGQYILKGKIDAIRIGQHLFVTPEAISRYIQIKETTGFQSKKQHHKRRQVRRLSAEEFLARYVKPGDPNECWEWKGTRNKQGYGVIRAFGKSTAAHRVAYRVAFGDFPPELKVRHLCDNPPCCNPAHLLLGTQQDNVRDRDERGRGRHLGTPGEKHPMHKLTEDDVRAIRDMAKDGISQTKIGKKFGIGQGHVSRIVLAKEWKHIPSSPPKPKPRPPIVLSDDDVIRIRRLAASGVTQRRIARNYGVAEATISRIVRRRRYKYLP